MFGFGKSKPKKQDAVGNYRKMQLALHDRVRALRGIGSPTPDSKPEEKRIRKLRFLRK
jgi:hypothetical protein